jgi:hypothetical protein
VQPRAAGAGAGYGTLVRLSTIALALVALLLGALPAAAADPDPTTATTIEAEGVAVVYWPGHETLARRTLDAAIRPQRLPGIPPDRQLTAGTVYLAPSPEIFDSLTGGGVPEWGAGVAIPSLRRIVLPTYPAPGPAQREPATTLRHEIAHLALHAYLPAPIPRWFDEGYATWTSGGWDQSAAWQIRAAFLLGRGPRLDSLTLSWPRGAEQARLAYLLSASAVQYLVEIGGERAFTALLDVWREEGSFDVALRRVYGMTPGQFETSWRRMVQRRYGWLLALSQVTVLWGFLAIFLVALYILRRRRSREKLDRMEAEDRLLPPEDIADSPWAMPPPPTEPPPAEPPPAAPGRSNSEVGTDRPG